MIQHQAAQEAEILKQMDSPLIVKCHGVFSGEGDPDCDGCGLCFVMEYMEAGSLHDVLLMHRRLLELAISGIARRVLEGLHYLYSLQIVPRDIKPSNLLINNKGEIKNCRFWGEWSCVEEAQCNSVSSQQLYGDMCVYESRKI